MPHIPVPQSLILALSATLALGGVPEAASAAQQVPPARTVTQAVPAQPGAAGAATQYVLPDDRTAAEIRDQLEKLLDKYPPAVGRVFKIDPSLMANPAYLSPYPGLSGFLTQHPEISRNPSYFLDNISSGYSYAPPTREQEVLRMWDHLLQGVAIFFVFTVVASFLVWLIRNFLDYRRWLRLSKIQVDVHTKLFDRLTVNEDLLSYIQTPAGRKFLESAPIMVEAAGSPIGSPARRVLWAVQAGLVLGAGALGLIFVSRGVPEEIAQAVRAVGWLSLFLGVGFLLSGAVSFLLSKRLGLFGPPSAAGNGGASSERT
jgi:hypothetical protein